MSNKKIVTVNFFFSDSYSCTFYEDGSYRFSSYKNDEFSRWKIEDNKLYFRHSGATEWTKWMNDSKNIINAISSHILDNIILTEEENT